LPLTDEPCGEEEDPFGILAGWPTAKCRLVAPLIVLITKPSPLMYRDQDLNWQSGIYDWRYATLAAAFAFGVQSSILA